MLFRYDEIITNVRVVFNGSFPSSNGLSFNSMVYVGPNLLPKVFNMVWHSRQYPILITSDVTKMYRQGNYRRISKQIENLMEGHVR